MGKTHKRWPVAEKRRIVELTLEPEASVAHLAQAAGVNANQVFQWRREFHNGVFQSGGSAGPPAAFDPYAAWTQPEEHRR